MKKFCLLFTCLLLLAGCSSLFDTYNGVKLVEEMGKLVNQENQNDQILQKMTNPYNQIDQIIQSGGTKGTIKPEDANQILGLLAEAKKQVPIYQKAVQQVQSQFPSIKEKAAKLEEKKTKQLANQFISDFTKTTEIELEFTNVLAELITLDEARYQALAEKKIPPTQENYDQLVTKYNDLNTQLQNQIKQFNQSWVQFNESVTGQPIKKK